MSAKPSKKSAKKNPVSAPAGGAPAPAAVATTSVTSAAATATPPAPAAWIDSTDPRKRTMGKVVLVGIWIYVAALWLLALDQTFHWGIFGPKVPPVP
jgi:hypothetical protein